MRYSSRSASYNDVRVEEWKEKRSQQDAQQQPQPGMHRISVYLVRDRCVLEANLQCRTKKEFPRTFVLLPMQRSSSQSLKLCSRRLACEPPKSRCRRKYVEEAILLQVEGAHATAYLWSQMTLVRSACCERANGQFARM
jgi:hypothetical protein